jgi:formate dehydrogenase subunit gamma
VRTEVIPSAPVPVTAAEAEAMSQRQIKKHHIAIILLHWFNAATWALELATGLALISSPWFRVAPEWYLSVMQDVFGSRASLLRVHVVAGLAWIGVYLVYGVFGWRTYLAVDVLRNEIGLDASDWRWLVVRVLRILGRSRDPLPAQGIYNAGQKLFALLVYVMIPIIMLTGLAMAFRWPSSAVVGWAVVVHFAAVAAVVSGLLIHVYMGAVFPEEKPAFFSMITGTVNEWYAYRHHFTWWRSVKLAEQTWAEQHDRAIDGLDDRPEKNDTSGSPEVTG